MSVNDDKLRIPIEIKTDDLKELQQLIQDISEAESDVRSLKPRSGRSGDTTSRSAFAGTSIDERGGIFGGIREGEALPQKTRDKTSKQAFQREREFDKMQDRINTLEQSSNETINTIAQVANTLGMAGLAAPLLNIKNRGFTGKVSSGLVAGKSAIPSMGTKSFSFGGATGIIGRAGGAGAMAAIGVTIAIDIFTSIMDELKKSGGPLDMRFKRMIADEISSATERREKAEIAQGIRLIRISAHSGFRGVTESVSGRATSRGTPIYDQNMELRSKGVI